MTASSSLDPVQSACRQRHSTERTLQKVTKDNDEGFDCRKSAIFVASDQSAAFDCLVYTGAKFS